MKKRKHILTAEQQAVLNFIKAYIIEHQRPPTKSSVADHMGWSSTNAASFTLNKLASEKYISLASGTSRGITVLNNTLKWKKN